MSGSAAAFYRIAKKVAELQSAGIKIISLNIGHTALPPPTEALDVLRATSSKELSSYGHPSGLKELREEISLREGVPVDQIVVGSGSKFILFALLSIFKRKGIVLRFPEPYWPAYPLICNELDLTFSTIRTELSDHWQLPEIDITPNSAILVCNPQNPTSTNYSSERLSELGARLEGIGSYLIIDEAYRGLSFNPISTPSNAIRVRSFSKEFNLESWRVGYIIAPPDICSAITQFIQISTTCTPTIIQRAAANCLRNVDAIVNSNREIWSGRLAILERELQRYGFEFARAESAMYLFASHPKIKNCEEYCEKLIEHGVAVAPGTAFGNYPEFMRISASASEEDLLVATRIMSEVVNG